jgi:hypothetical protein
MKGPADTIAWAKRPKSREALDAVRELASRDRRFAAIWRCLVEEEVATAEGKPLKVWDGTRWLAVDRGRRQ